MSTHAHIAKDRDALYYPYIHIRDVDWLKRTLLCFPQIRRMVPADFKLRDSDEVLQFRQSEGPHGPLLVDEVISASDDGIDGDTPVSRARTRLRSRLVAEDKEFLRKFSKDATSKDFAPDAFQIFKGKLGGIFAFLRDNDLAWHSERRADPDEWLCVHPALGEAIMSTIAIAIAKSKGLDVVTSSANAHQAVFELNEQQVYDRLVGRPVEHAPPSAADQVDELAQLVVAMNFDVRSVDAKAIAEVQKNGAGLQSFKNQLALILSSVPDISDPAELNERLKKKVPEIIESWQAHRKSLMFHGLDALIEVKDIKPVEITGLLGASVLSIWAGAGIAVGLVAYGGYKVWQKFKANQTHPLRFLSEIKRAGAVFTSEVRRRDT